MVKMQDTPTVLYCFVCNSPGCAVSLPEPTVHTVQRYTVMSNVQYEPVLFQGFNSVKDFQDLSISN
jgi:hypothetical protein